jgi:putative CocE/NonD family hydrolase
MGIRARLRAAACLALLAAPAVALADFDVRARYEKSEHLLAMRDGVKLFTAVYRPKDCSARYPILLQRTPYSIAPYGAAEYKSASDLAPSEDFVRDGYIFVFQDARGAHKSEGDWVDMRPPLSAAAAKRGVDETTDTYDTIEWLLKNVPGNNGNVGQWGISYPAWYSVMGMLRPHPALKAVSPQATTADAFIGDDFHHNGVFILTGLIWTQRMSIAGQARLDPSSPLSKIEYGTPWSYEFFLGAGPPAEMSQKYFGGRLMRLWSDFIEHPDYDGYWKSRDFLAPLENIRLPVLNVAGWFDEFDMYGAFATYQGIERKNPGNRSTLVAGPWRHGGWTEDDGASLGDMRFGEPTSEYFKKRVVFPFFQHHLKGHPGWDSTEAVVFETGGNRWHHLERWPPRGVTPRKLYFQPDGRLSFDAPMEHGEGASDSYVSDPAKPVPFTTEISMEEGYRWMVADQRYAYSRPDVVSWQTEPLTHDVTIAGSILAELFVSTTGTDSDWYVKLIDVHPSGAPGPDTGTGKVVMGGYQMMLGFEVMRGRYRESFERPVPMAPGAVTGLSFRLWDKFHTFKKGHRMMVQVQSSMFPFFERNPQVFMSTYHARESDYRKTTQKVHRSAEAPSHLVLPVLN